MVNYMEVMVPFEVRVEGVDDESSTKLQVQDIILNNGGNARGGIARYRVVPAKSNGRSNGRVTIFIALRRPYYHPWLLALLKRHNIQCYAEDHHWVFQPDPLPFSSDADLDPRIVNLHHINPPQPFDRTERPPSQPIVVNQTPVNAPEQPNIAPSPAAQHQTTPPVTPIVPPINIYPQIHLHVDSSQLVNRLIGGRGRVVRQPITLPQPGVTTQIQPDLAQPTQANEAAQDQAIQTPPNYQVDDKSRW